MRMPIPLSPACAYQPSNAAQHQFISALYSLKKEVMKRVAWGKKRYSVAVALLPAICVVDLIASPDLSNCPSRACGAAHCPHPQRTRLHAERARRADRNDPGFGLRL